MRRIHRLIVLVGMVLPAALEGAGTPARISVNSTGSTPTTPHVIATDGGLPLRFEANLGQTDGRVRFLSRGSGSTVFLTPHDMVVTAAGTNGTAVRIELVGANPEPAIVGDNLLPGKSNYFIGNDPGKWRTNVPSYARVRYTRVYPVLTWSTTATTNGTSSTTSSWRHMPIRMQFVCGWLAPGT